MTVQLIQAKCVHKVYKDPDGVTKRAVAFAVSARELVMFSSRIMQTSPNILPDLVLGLLLYRSPDIIIFSRPTARSAEGLLRLGLCVCQSVIHFEPCDWSTWLGLNGCN